jgi:hypothetical protein
MLRDSHIPLFLWIATALLAHLLWGGGADKTAKKLEETDQIRDFASSVRDSLTFRITPMELALSDEAKSAEPDVDPEESDAEDPKHAHEPKAKQEPVEPEREQPEQKPKEPELVVVKEKEREKLEELLQQDAKKRIAVRQHVKDENQPDNPDAEFIADQANRVEEQTQARITSTDQNDPSPNPGGNFTGPNESPGDSEEARLGQSEDRVGEPDRASSDASQAEQVKKQEAATAAARAQNEQEQRRVQAQERRQEVAKADPMPEAHRYQHGAFDFSDPNEARRRIREQEAQKRRRSRQRSPTDLLGLGARGTTENGVNLNLTPNTAVAAIGRDQLQKERKEDGEKRRSKHVGSWKTLGIERWRSAIENYVPSVKPGNQTALNTARVPFASYLNTIHNRLHPIFAMRFLGSLDRLPNSHPMNRSEMSTNLEIVLDREEGRLVRMGITKTSGVTAFDIGALESVSKAQPFGTPPKEIVSPDGNVYFHWEFWRNPYYACSTYFARPYLLKVKPKQAPPAIEPPTRPPFRPLESPEQDRHGLFEPYLLIPHAGARAAR